MKINSKRHNEKGEALFITTILILVMMIIAGASMNAAGMQLDMAYFQRNTSNTYYLAKSGAEKGADMINQAIGAQMPLFIDEMREKYLLPVTDLEAAREAARGDVFVEGVNAPTELYSKNHIIYSVNAPKNEEKWMIDQAQAAQFLKEKIYGFIEKEFLNKDVEVTYDIKGDGQKDTDVKVQVTFHVSEPTDPYDFRIKAVARRKDGKDIKIAEALMKIEGLDAIDNEIHEAYDWLYHTPEILDSAVTCFSDVVVTDGAKLTIVGDLRVKGTTKKTVIGQNTAGNPVLIVPDINEMGGVIASNGGALEVKSPQTGDSTISRTSRSYSSPLQVSISNRIQTSSSVSHPSMPEAENFSSNTGSIYCMNNVAVTHGWKPEDAANPEGTTDLAQYERSDKASITVQGDVIANTLAVYNDLYEGGYNQSPFGGIRVVKDNKIHIQGNVFVDNDVVIDRYVSRTIPPDIPKDEIDPTISVGGAIFGISDGSFGTVLEADGIQYKDPNASSGVFSRGNNTLIEAKRIFVNGQPFIDFGRGKFYALWESIGEPFQDVSTVDGYEETATSLTGSTSYLQRDFDLYDRIKTNQITINGGGQVEGYVYTPSETYVSANGAIEQYNHLYFKDGSGVKDEAKARSFFYKGGFGYSIKDMTGEEYDQKYDWINKMFGNTDRYYQANKNYDGDGEGVDYLSDPSFGLYYKKYFTGEPLEVTENYRGLRGYMTAKRSVFYGVFGTDKNPTDLAFQEVVDIDRVPQDSYKWNYATPIEIIKGGKLKVEDYYVTDEEGDRPYPTLLISRGKDNKLVLEGGKRPEDTKTFKGIIISEGNVELEGYLNIEGTLIIGGKSPLGDPNRATQGGLTARDKIMLGQEVGLSLSSAITTTEVKITHNPDMLLQMGFGDKILFRSILDALKLTQFQRGKGENEDERAQAILRHYNSEPIIYTQGRMKLSAHSILDVTTKNIGVKIQRLRKINA